MIQISAVMGSNHTSLWRGNAITMFVWYTLRLHCIFQAVVARWLRCDFHPGDNAANMHTTTLSSRYSRRRSRRMGRRRTGRRKSRRMDLRTDRPRTHSIHLPWRTIRPPDQRGTLMQKNMS